MSMTVNCLEVTVQTDQNHLKNAVISLYSFVDNELNSRMLNTISKHLYCLLFCFFFFHFR